MEVKPVNVPSISSTDLEISYDSKRFKVNGNIMVLNSDCANTQNLFSYRCGFVIFPDVDNLLKVGTEKKLDSCEGKIETVTNIYSANEVTPYYGCIAYLPLKTTSSKRDYSISYVQGQIPGVASK